MIGKPRNLTYTPKIEAVFEDGTVWLTQAQMAELYGVVTKVFNQAVNRNIERFPEDFMFQLTWEECENLKSQIVTLNSKRGQHIKYLPYAFTAQGVAMLNGVLHSPASIPPQYQNECSSAATSSPTLSTPSATRSTRKAARSAPMSSPAPTG